MSTPIYESDADRSRERKVAEHLAIRWRSLAVPTAPFSPVDYAMCRLDPKDAKFYARAYIEIKCRSKLYDPYWVSKAKWEDLLILRETTELPCYLIVHDRTTKHVHYLPVDRTRYQVAEGGRHDRPDDPKSIEPMMVIPASSFSSAGLLDVGP